MRVRGIESVNWKGTERVKKDVPLPTCPRDHANYAVRTDMTMAGGWNFWRLRRAGVCPLWGRGTKMRSMSMRAAS